MPARRLTRLPTQGQIAGVCAGLAEYFDIDVVFIRVAWVVLSIVPGAIIGGVLAYIAAWLLMPEASAPVAAPAGRRLTRSVTDKKVAGVCGGLAEYFGVDATPIRLLWAILSIFCGAIVGGVIAYVVAWAIIPRSPETALTAPTPAPVA
ncbi:MAG: PspC domain-containing protein [Acidobacteria bacterium]|nr:MAG: PspC domain-containing protein [Acidobacteriota bacterium]